MSVYIASMKQCFMNHLSGRMKGLSGTLIGQRKIIFSFFTDCQTYESMNLKNQHTSFLKLGEMP